MNECESPIPERLYFRIGDVSKISGVKPHVLRYWESEFPFISPEKSVTGQRVYRRKHVEAVLLIKRLLYSERYSIEGAKKRIRELRKVGELKNFREEAAFQPSVGVVSSKELGPTENTASTLTSESLQEILNLAHEFKELTCTPVAEIFLK